MATTNPSLFGMLGDEQYMQRQLDEQRAKAFAEQTQEQRLAGMGYSAGAQLGRGLAGAFGVDVTDPTIRKASQLRALASQFDTTTPEGIRKYAMAIKDIDPNVAVQASQMADEMDKEQSIALKNRQEKKTNEERNAEALADSSGAPRNTPEWQAAYNKNLITLTTKKEGTSEAERIIDSLPLPDAQKQQLKQQRLTALLNPESNMLKGLDAQLKMLQAQVLNRQMSNLPDSAIKFEEDDVSKIDALSSLTDTLQKPIEYLTPDKKTGISKLDLSPKKIFEYNTKNISGNSDAQSLMYADLKQAVAHATNIKTDAAKGVQTDRDVLRFANELVSAFASNDTKAMLRSLTNMKNAQEKEQNKLKDRVNSRRASYQVAPRYQSGEPSKQQGTVDNPIVLK